jgi:hypothetical protein
MKNGFELEQKMLRRKFLTLFGLIPAALITKVSARSVDDEGPPLAWCECAMKRMNESYGANGCTNGHGVQFAVWVQRDHCKCIVDHYNKFRGKDYPYSGNSKTITVEILNTHSANIARQIV